MSSIPSTILPPSPSHFYQPSSPEPQFENDKVIVFICKGTKTSKSTLKNHYQVKFPHHDLTIVKLKKMNVASYYLKYVNFEKLTPRSYLIVCDQDKIKRYRPSNFFNKFIGIPPELNGSPSTLDALPLLPEEYSNHPMDSYSSSESYLTEMQDTSLPENPAPILPPRSSSPLNTEVSSSNTPYKSGMRSLASLLLDLPKLPLPEGCSEDPEESSEAYLSETQDTTLPSALPEASPTPLSWPDSFEPLVYNWDSIKILLKLYGHSEVLELIKPKAKSALVIRAQESGMNLDSAKQSPMDPKEDQENPCGKDESLPSTQTPIDQPLKTQEKRGLKRKAADMPAMPIELAQSSDFRLQKINAVLTIAKYISLSITHNCFNFEGLMQRDPLYHDFKIWCISHEHLSSQKYFFEHNLKKFLPVIPYKGDILFPSRDYCYAVFQNRLHAFHMEVSQEMLTLAEQSRQRSITLTDISKSGLK